MGIHTKKIIISVILLGILINPVSGQDYYYGETQYMFSEHLKAGMEFTWEFKKFSFEFINGSLGLDQMVTSTATTTSETTSDQTTSTIYGNQTTSTAYDDQTTTTIYDESYTTTTYEEVIIEFPEVPDVQIGTLYTIKLLKDIGNLTDEFIYADFENDNSYKEYFDISISSGDAETLIPFFGINGFIYTSVIEYDNGTRYNQFEVRYQEEMKRREEFSDSYADYDVGPLPELSIVDGVYIESMHFVEGNTSIITFQRTDIETGILLSISGSISSPQFLYEVDVELHETKGIDLNNLEPNETLSLPISAVFVYTLFLIPIVINKIKSKKEI